MEKHGKRYLSALKKEGGMINTTNETPQMAILEKYYEKVAWQSIDENIRNQCIEVANQVADEILAGIDLKKLIVSKSKNLDKDKVVVAIQFEKKKP
jgi:hypothetical protein